MSQGRKRESRIRSILQENGANFYRSVGEIKMGRMMEETEQPNVTCAPCLNLIGANQVLNDIFKK